MGMNEYRFRGTRKSDGAPVESRMLAENEVQLKKTLGDYGVDLESAERLATNSRAKAGIGCGTVILVLLILGMINAIRSQRDDLNQLKSTIDAQNSVIEELREDIEQLRSDREKTTTQ